MNKTLSKVVYRAARGAPFANKDASAIGKHLERIEEANGGITPEVVVEDAREETSLLHRYFSWDNREAAQAWRLHQARNLINHLLVVVETDGKEIEAKGFHSVTVTSADNEEDNRSYASLATVSESPEMRKQVVAQALREIEYWQKRYGDLKELLPIAKAIDKAKRRMRKRKPEVAAKAG